VNSNDGKITKSATLPQSQKNPYNENHREREIGLNGHDGHAGDISQRQREAAYQSPGNRRVKKPITAITANNGNNGNNGKP